MTYCSQCGTKAEENAKFCGNCGSPIHSAGLQSNQSSNPNQMNQSAEETFGPGADAIIAFVSGGTFKWVLGVFGVISIGYALATGGLSSSRVPSVGEQIRPRIPTRNIRPSTAQRTNPTSNSVTRRFQAQQQQRNSR